MRDRCLSARSVGWSSVGYLMGGSGLKELMSTIYAPVSVKKMLLGHAFGRAV